ncbi:hypothetical protein A3Q56_04757 [Intoshia linei]|uniref:SUEL-type lectin domain-containing protein n=1 Tax=Intoshia linei TaxID=1819745 RepID=A0A177B1K1_9BILA|nr:hypothetical protein A3Q56_04757 [Intoshia linei]
MLKIYLKLLSICLFINLLTLIKLEHIILNSAIDKLYQICENNIITINCKGYENYSTSNDLILITIAKYGRMSLNSCIRRNYGYIGCQKSVIHVLHEICSGKSHCTFNVPNSQLDNSDVCPHDLKSFLQFSYRCIKAPSVCSTRNIVGKLNATSVQKYLTNFKYINSKIQTCSSNHIKKVKYKTNKLNVFSINYYQFEQYTIVAKSELRINVTIYDLGFYKSHSKNAVYTSCVWNLTISENYYGDLDKSVYPSSKIMYININYGSIH